MRDTSTTDRSPWAVFLVFLRLGLTSFGGSIVHLGYCRDEFMTRRQSDGDGAHLRALREAQLVASTPHTIGE